MNFTCLRKVTVIQHYMVDWNEGMNFLVFKSDGYHTFLRGGGGCVSHMLMISSMAMWSIFNLVVTIEQCLTDWNIFVLSEHVFIRNDQ